MSPDEAGRRARFHLPGRTDSQIRREIGEELEFHIAARAAALVRQGIDPQQARAGAEREFGDIERTRAYCAAQDSAVERARRRAAWHRDLSSDLRVAVRSAGRRPLHAAVAIATLALGLASVLAMSTVVRRLVLSPNPYPGGDRLVTIWQQPPGGGDVLLLPFSDAADAWRVRATTLEGVEDNRPRGPDAARRRRGRGSGERGRVRRAAVVVPGNDRGARPRIHGRRPACGSAGGGAHQPRALAAPLCQRAGHRGPAHPTRRRSGRDRGRGAAGLARRAGPGNPNRCLASGGDERGATDAMVRRRPTASWRVGRHRGKGSDRYPAIPGRRPAARPRHRHGADGA